MKVFYYPHELDFIRSINDLVFFYKVVLKNICNFGYYKKNTGIILRINWNKSLNQFVFDLSNEKTKRFIDQENCLNLNLKNLIEELNENKEIELFRKIKLLPNENRSLVFSSNKDYSDIELIGLYNKNSFDKKMILIDDLKEYKEIKSLFKHFYVSNKLLLQENYLNAYNKIKLNKDINKYRVKVGNKIQDNIISFTNEAVLKNNFRKIQKSYSKKEIDQYFYGKNRKAIELVYLDFNIQKEIMKYLNSDIYFLLREKNLFIKIKSIMTEVLLEKEENYNLPLLPMSF